MEKGKYKIIYADPPWSYENSNFLQNEKGKRGKVTSSALKHYNTMTNDDIKKLPIEELADKDCLLFMWTSSPHLEIAIQVMECWGFDYKTLAFCWDKQVTLPSSYTMSQIELCLVGKKKKGKIPQPRGKRNIKQFLSLRRERHSQKPNEVRDRITKMFPTQNKIELFARDTKEINLFGENRFDGWDCWGNEVESDIKL